MLHVLPSYQLHGGKEHPAVSDGTQRFGLQSAALVMVGQLGSAHCMLDAVYWQPQRVQAAELLNHDAHILGLHIKVVEPAVSASMQSGIRLQLVETLTVT